METRIVTGAVAGARTESRPGWFAATLRRPGWVRLYYIISLLILWEIGARIYDDPLFMSPPSKIAPAMMSVLANADILWALGQAFVEILAAFALSVGVGLALGLLLGLNRFAYHLFYKLILVLYGLPKVTIFPLILLAFGIGAGTKIAFGFAHGVFPIVVAVVAGLQGQDESLVRAATAMGANRRNYFRWVIFPELTLSLFTGTRLSMAGVLLGVILAELYVSVMGIGYYTTRFSQNFQPANLFALVIILAAMAILLNEALRRIELHYSRWRTGAAQA
jgi:ABC-type nitrate/sulfonate/bicarbonate transport system permease component